jgi:dTDP-4-dehydrorhamnose 3,5-epimerase
MRYTDRIVTLGRLRSHAMTAALAVTQGPIEGLWLIDLRIHEDPDRPGASFREVFHADKMTDLGLPPFTPVQWNVSESAEGTLRGFHAEPWDKFVHVAAGEVFSAIADLRPASATFGEVWTGRLDRTKALFVSRGLGNGFQAVTPVAVYGYLVNEHWRPDATYPAVAWDDPDLDVAWPITDDRLSLSAKDRANPPLADLTR